MAAPPPALRACRRHDEAWAALATAKVLTGPGPEWEAEDYRAMLEDLAVIFPPAEEAAAGAGVEVVDEDEEGGDEEAQGQGGQEEAPPQPASAAGAPAAAPAEQQGAGAAGAAGGAAQRLGRAAARAGAALAEAASSLRAWLARVAKAVGGGGRASEQGAPAPAPGPSKFAHLGEVRPIFVTGLPRSGSTLIEQILSRCGSCHPAAALTLP